MSCSVCGREFGPKHRIGGICAVVPKKLPPAGRKDDHGKPRFNLVPPRAIEAVARVLSYGAAKYGPENWRRVEGLRDRYLDAALRHLNAHQRGEIVDQESGLPHLAHAACSLLFILEDAALSSSSTSGSVTASAASSFEKGTA